MIKINLTKDYFKYIFIIPFIAVLLIIGSLFSLLQKQECSSNQSKTCDEASLIYNLKQKGLQIRISEDKNFPLLLSADTTNKVTFDNIPNEEITVYEFKDSDSADEVSKKIDKNDPSKVGNAEIDWVKPAYFFKSERIITLYSGTNEQILNSLKELMGTPISEKN